jgi:hypothetical protein
VAVSITVETMIKKPRDEVAAFVMDPRNDQVWIGGITSSRALTDLPVRVGTRVERIAKFLGRRIEYVTEVTEFDPPRLLAMKSIKSPFPLRVRYEFEEKNGSTVVRNHLEGEPGGFYSIGGPFLARSVKSSAAKDLETLKRHLESGERMK